MRRKYKAVVSTVLTAALVAGMAVSAEGTTAQAKAKTKTVALSAKSIQVNVGGTKTIKVKNTKKSVKWSVKSGKKYISLTKKKKTSVSVKGKKAGSAVVLAKVSGKKLTCKVKVNKKKSANHYTGAYQSGSYRQSGCYRDTKCNPACGKQRSGSADGGAISRRRG